MDGAVRVRGAMLEANAEDTLMAPWEVLRMEVSVH